MADEALDMQEKLAHIDQMLADIERTRADHLRTVADYFRTVADHDRKRHSVPVPLSGQFLSGCCPYLSRQECRFRMTDKE